MRRIAMLMALVVAFALVPSFGASAASCDNQTNNTYKKLLDCTSLAGAQEHRRALQDIADANGGIRTSGTPGYDESAAYAAEVFEAAGYDVTIQEFEFQTFIVLAPTVLQQVSPLPERDLENNIMSYSGSGDVTASVSTVTPILGCNASDFAGFPAGDIALISRGTCTFATKATNAFNAGAVGVVIYNNQPGVINGTLGATFTLDIPVTSVTQELGLELAGLANGVGLELRLSASTFRGIATTSNVLAESKWGNPDNTVMVGAHLDSVNAGPGLQDNGSGSAAILDVAQAMSKSNGVNQVRFALWGAEESGLVGSTFYVSQLSQEEQDEIALYLNFDMIGSPNHVFFIYDGDDSDMVGAPAGPDGSDDIEKLFESFYTQVGESYKGTDFSGRSDYGPFIAVGIPSGGLFTGAEGIKTAEEQAIWGGTAGIQYDPCYHLACDTYDNLNPEAYDVNVDAVAYTSLTYAYSTEVVNGVPGKKVPSSPAIGTPSATAAGYAGSASSGLGSDDHATS